MIKASRMFRCLKTKLFLSILICLVFSNAYAGDSTEAIKITINDILNILNDPVLKKTEKTDERKNLLHKFLKKSFDEEEFARRSLKGHWDKLTDGQRKEFSTIFIDLLESTYFDRIDDYVKGVKDFSSENITFENEKVKGRFAVVETKINIGSTRCIPVDYRMINKNDKWVVCDMVIEGVSIVKNYRAQFNEILANNSFNELMLRLKNKKN